jgi:PAS domain S-box-containing protein
VGTAGRETGLRGDVDYKIVRILAESPDLSDAAPKLLEAIGTALGSEAGSLWALDEKSGSLRCADSWSAPGVEIADFEARTTQIGLAPGVGLPGRVLDTGRPAWIEDVTLDSNFPRAEAAAAAGLRGGFAFPIMAKDDEVFGVIEFFSRTPLKPDQRLMSGMLSWGIQIGQFIIRKRVEEAVRESEALKSAIIECALDCVITIDHESTIREFNPAAEQTFGYRRSEAIGRDMADLIIPPTLRDRHRRGVARYLATGEGIVMNKHVELPGMRADGSEFPAELTITRIGTDEPPRFVGFVRDITARKKDESALRFLAAASVAFDSSLDLDQTLQNVARISVPFLADACSIELVERGGQIRQVAAAASDSAVEETMVELGRYPIDPVGPHPVAEVVREGRVKIYEEMPDSLLEAIASSTEHLDLLRMVPTPTGGVVVPLTARGRMLGAISFGCIGTMRKVTTIDRSLVEDVARRAATAIDNARLYSERGTIANTLQHSLLPPRLPEIPGVEIAARFRPGGEGTELGGDFYDVFDVGDAGWVIAIGDVFGKGADAAAITALARYTLRAAAMREPSLEAMLGVLNDALLWQLPAQQFCTLACARLEVTEAGLRLALAAAGHPLPLLLHPDGRVDLIGAPGTLLGVFPEPSPAYQELELEPGDTIVFYTDGVTEARTGDGTFGEKLNEAVASCAGLDAVSAARQIEETLIEAETEVPRDDAIILVVRYDASRSEHRGREATRAEPLA